MRPAAAARPVATAMAATVSGWRERAMVTALRGRCPDRDGRSRMTRTKRERGGRGRQGQRARTRPMPEQVDAKGIGEKREERGGE